MTAMEYIDMISSTAMTPIATGPRFLIISLIVKALAVAFAAWLPPPPWSCNKNSRPSVLVPTKLIVGIVTVEPSKKFAALERERDALRRCATGVGRQVA